MLCQKNKKKPTFEMKCDQKEGRHVSEKSSCCPEKHNHDCSSDPCTFTGLKHHLSKHIGSLVEVETPAGIVTGVLSVVREDYAVVTVGTTICFMHFQNILAVTILS
ncbi:DUF2642 domain-containing protein [Cytobacillus purgationiresistens]|uniref:DUF2642 domain-containing protein n=1 Tax=Cytobacillus purgationiresistens TaxID=863449 RepID=A0ABU0AKB5_9BACI|nr:DUF2642 domain-containing protein [Cytobacillus purgationiresistens]MDQ0271721.1 hypothetical protein [Cytobacillus purgationiresistens]MDQ0271733.1 hypothetical protein [Cytobacillus purgationiresistens]